MVNDFEDRRTADELMKVALADQLAGRYTSARSLYARVLAQEPDNTVAHMNLGTVLLTLGEFAPGWREFSWRQRLQSNQLPIWDGTHLGGKGILVRGEQGAGDNIQFMRYLPMVAAMGGPVSALTLPGMGRLFSSMHESATIFEPGEKVSGLHVEIPIMDLPGILGTTASSIPASIPYLHAETGLTESWRLRLGPPKGFRVGLCWQGNPDRPRDALRSVPLDQFGPLISVPGTQWFGLQVGPGEDQVTSFNAPGSFAHLGPHLRSGPDKFVNDAAVMEHLDLIISVDTSVAHLAGAMGKSVWILLAREADWRWMLERQDSPWYPTARLFRQTVSGDWGAPLSAMTAELTTEVNRRPQAVDPH